MLTDVLKPVHLKVQEALLQGLDLHRAGDLVGAGHLYHHILAMDPDHADALQLLGAIHLANQQFGLAYNLISRAIDKSNNPTDSYYNNLGFALQGLNKKKESMKAFRRALELNPNHIESWQQLVLMTLDDGQLGEAAKLVRIGLYAYPNIYQGWTNLGNILLQLGRIEEAEQAFRRSLQLQPNYLIPLHNIMMCAQYTPGITLEKLAEYHKEFAAAMVPLRSKPPLFQNSRNAKKKLRVGFLSGDLRRHPVGYYMAPFLPHIDRSEMEIFCYSDSNQVDDMTGHVRAGSDHWVEVPQLTHKALADQIRKDRIDILFDLSGHAGHARLMVFLHRPAPIQVTWQGYVGTTGLEEMDYIVADPFHIREEEEKYYLEKPLRISDCVWVIRPPDFAPDVGPLPALTNGYVTFGTFSISSKINPEIVKVWSRIMRQVPHSRLMLKYKAMDDPTNRDRIERLFFAEGIDPARIMLYGTTPHVDLLNHHGFSFR